MLVYEVKINIDSDVESEWLDWMKKVHVPDVLATGLIEKQELLIEEEGDVTYYLFQYFFPDQEAYDTYNRDYGPALKADTTQKYGGRFRASRRTFFV